MSIITTCYLIEIGYIFSIRVDIQSQKLVYSISADILKMVYKRTWSLSISDGLIFVLTGARIRQNSKSKL